MKYGKSFWFFLPAILPVTTGGKCKQSWMVASVERLHLCFNLTSTYQILSTYCSTQAIRVKHSNSPFSIVDTLSIKRTLDVLWAILHASTPNLTIFNNFGMSLIKLSVSVFELQSSVWLHITWHDCIVLWWRAWCVYSAALMLGMKVSPASSDDCE